MCPGAGHAVLTSDFASGGALATSTTSCCEVVDVCVVVELTVEQPNEKSESDRAMERVMFMAADQEHATCHALARSRAASIGRLHARVEPAPVQCTPAYRGK